MTPVTVLMRYLAHVERSGTVGSLLGDGWDSYWRVLHPATRSDGQELRPAGWGDIARARGVDFLPARSTWQDVSGVAPHSDQLTQSGIAVEPAEGADDAALHWLLIEALMRSAGDETVDVAEWAGYGDSTSAGSGIDIRVARESYRVLKVGRDDLPLSTGFRANYAAGDTGRWLVAADMDLMSTYVGISAPVTPEWPSELEVAKCTGGDPIS